MHRFVIAAALLGMLLPAAASNPAQPEAQINTYPDGFFYSAGRSYLGVEVRDITSERVSALKLKEERGVEVTMVDQDAPAGKAGLKEHDVILDYNGTRVESEEQFRRMIHETPPGRSVTLGVSRDGSPVSVTAQIGDRGKLSSQIFKGGHGAVILPPEMPEPLDFNIPFDVQTLTYTPSLGIQVDNLNQQLGEFFGVKNGEGLLVKSVEKGSPAEKAGMKAGDVITRAENEKISDRSDLRRVLRSHRSGGKVTLGIVRDKHEQNLTIDVPARRSGDSSGIEIWGPGISSFEDLESALQRVRPQIESAVLEKMQEVQPQLWQAQNALQRITPEMQKAMSQLQSKMKIMQENLQKVRQEWRDAVDNWI